MTKKRDRAIDIASEMARHIDAGSSQEEIDASTRRAFPGVTVELDRARAIGFDQIDQIAMWLENEDARPEDVSVFDLMMSGAPATKIDAAIACGNGTRSPQLRNYGANQMLDTSQITTEFTRLITTGTYEQAMLVAVAQLFRRADCGRTVAGPTGGDCGGGEAGCAEALTGMTRRGVE